MQERFDITLEEPLAFKTIYGLQLYVQNSGLDKRYVCLLEIRSSQINGCAYCVDNHTKEARKAGFSEQWISLIAVWKESPIFDPKERAVLNWAESVTRVSHTGIPDQDYELLREYFSLKEIAQLTVAVSTINVWNRMALALRLQHQVDPVPT